MPETDSRLFSFSELSRAFPDPLLLVDSSGRIHGANPPACRLLGRRRDQLLAELLGTLLEPSEGSLHDYLRRCSASREPSLGGLRVRESGEALRSEGVLLRPRGSEAPALLILRLRPRTVTNQRFRLLTQKIESLGREVVQRVRAETLLKGQHRALEQIARGAALSDSLEELVRIAEEFSAHKVLASVLILDEEKQTLRHGAGASLPESYRQAIDGIAIGPAVGSCGTAAYHNRVVVVEDIASDPLWQDFRELALQHGLRACWSTPIESRQGGVLGTFALYYTEARTPEPDIEATVALMTRTAGIAIERSREESQREMLLERERQARNAAETADRAKDEFLALVSHELRNPLNAMLGWTRLLATDELDRETFARGVAAVERNAELQAQLISDLLDFSRLSTGKFEVEPEPTELSGLVREAVESMQPAAEAEQIHLELECGAEKLPIHGDPERLQQVVSNLMSNALKFTPAQGRISVHCHRVGSQAELVVRDTGRGIRPELIDRIFERFRQGDTSIARDRGGLGLGLAVVRHIVEQHAGSVEAASDGPGRGATFSVRIPLSESFPEAPAPPLSADREQPALHGLRILVVEDQPDARDVLATSLRLQGAEVTAVGSASEGLEAMRGGTFSLLISDIGMPGMDGYAFLQQLRRQHPPSSRLRAIALTAYARDRDQQAALDAGFDAHLAKPFETERLIELVQQLATDGPATDAGTAGDSKAAPKPSPGPRSYQKDGES